LGAFRKPKERFLVKLAALAGLAICLSHAAPALCVDFTPLCKDFDPVAYLKAVDNPKPTAATKPEYKGAPAFAKILTGMSITAFCLVQQHALDGDLPPDNPAFNREVARDSLDNLLSGVVANRTPRREDLMLDFAKTWCQMNGCDCPQEVKDFRAFQDQHGSPY
jgi:hypothetical protein